MPNEGRYLFMDIPVILIHSIAIFFHFFYAEMKSVIGGMRRPHRRRRKTLVYIVLILCGLYFVPKLLVGPRYTFTNTDIYSQCIIPDLDPWDKSVLQFDWHSDPIACDSAPSVVFIDHTGRLQFNKSVIKQYQLDKLSCTYNEISRMSMEVF
jgi:hypothetical protein